MWTQVVKNGQNLYFCGKLNNFFWDKPKNSSFHKSTPVQKHYQEIFAIALRKIYTLRKLTRKWPKIDFPDMEFWLLADNRIFRPWIMRISIRKYTLSKSALKTTCNVVLFLFYFVYERQNLFLNFRQKLHLFSDIFFAWILWWGLLANTF